MCTQFEYNEYLEIALNGLLLKLTFVDCRLDLVLLLQSMTRSTSVVKSTRPIKDSSRMNNGSNLSIIILGNAQ